MFYYVNIGKWKYNDVDLVSQLGMEQTEILKLFLNYLFQALWFDPLSLNCKEG